jgi:hypothetical protein
VGGYSAAFIASMDAWICKNVDLMVATPYMPALQIVKLSAANTSTIEDGANTPLACASTRTFVMSDAQCVGVGLADPVKIGSVPGIVVNALVAAVRVLYSR